jgi:glutamine synthetase
MLALRIMIFSKNTSIKMLNSLLDQFKQLGLFPVMGAEIEFYLTQVDDNIKVDLRQELGLEIEEEKGINQFEIKTLPTNNILALANETISIRERVQQYALKTNISSDFSAKPFLDQPGSALHIHLHLENDKGENLYKRLKEETSLLLHSIGGLCSTMQENMLVFAPYEEAYLRYQGDSLEAPSKICWGGNNRSAAIRIPVDQTSNRRLEHRVACADSCPFEVMSVILSGVLKGIRENIQPPEKLFGNAYLEQYEFPLITRSYTQAKKDFKNNGDET